MESLITSQIIKEILEAPPRSLNAIKAELLFLDGAYVLHSREGNSSRYKYLSSATLRNAFSGVAIDSGWLDPSVIRWCSKPSGDWAVKFLAPALYKLDCNELGILTVPLPAMVFAGRGTKYWVWALKTQKFNPDARLFNAPLPNVYQRNGDICWGSNRPPACNPQSINTAWNMFIASPFSNHLADGKSQCYDQDIRVQLLALHTKKAKKYPVSDLKALQQNPTVNNLIEAIAHDD